MNERIREIAGKALDKAVPYTWHNLDHVEMEKVMNEFAKLIAKECADICKEQEYKYWRSSEEDHWTPIDSANAIEKHFGVEE